MSKTIGVRSGALERSIRAFSMDQQAKHEEAVEARAQESMGEFEQQFQVPLSGEAGSLITWTEVTATFASPFVLTDDRDSPHQYPQFWHGAVIESGPPVMVTACVRDWITTADGDVTGAKVAVGVCRPGVDEDSFKKFKGTVHLTFQGWSAPFDDEDETSFDEEIIAPAGPIEETA